MVRADAPIKMSIIDSGTTLAEGLSQQITAAFCTQNQKALFGHALHGRVSQQCFRVKASFDMPGINAELLQSIAGLPTDPDPAHANRQLRPVLVDPVGADAGCIGADEDHAGVQVEVENAAFALLIVGSVLRPGGDN